MNKYDLDGNYGIMTLPNGDKVKFDKEDYNIIKNYNWYHSADRNGHVRVRTHTEGKTIELSTILGYTKFRTSNKNGDELDYRKDNLEIRTKSQIGYTAPRYKNNTSGIKGVSFNKRKNKWAASIAYKGTTYHLGYYPTLLEATRARTIAGDMVFCHGYVNDEQKALAKLLKDSVEF